MRTMCDRSSENLRLLDLERRPAHDRQHGERGGDRGKIAGQQHREREAPVVKNRQTESEKQVRPGAGKGNRIEPELALEV